MGKDNNVSIENLNEVIKQWTKRMSEKTGNAAGLEPTHAGKGVRETQELPTTQPCTQLSEQT